jgi:hypothetical protein
MNIKKTSSLTRSLDMDYPDNRLIVLLCAVVFIASAVFRIVSGDHLVQGIIWGGRAALSIFFAWALAKEIDPDNPGSAITASAVGIPGLFFFNSSSLLVALFILFLLRMVNRTVGVPLTLPDSILIMLIGIYLVYTGKWMYGIVMSIAFIMDATLKEPVRRHFPYAVISMAAGLFSVYDNGIEIKFIPGHIFALLLLALFFISRILLAGQSNYLSDRSGQRLSSQRVIAACIVALAAGLLAIPEGSTAIIAAFPLWAAMGGTVAFDIVQRLIP